MEPRNTDSNRDVLFSSTEDSQQKAHITFTHTIFHAQLCHTHTHTYIHTYVRTYIHTYTYIRTLCILSFHILSHTVFHHLLCLSFLPVPARTFEAHYWKKLTCGVIRSFNFTISDDTLGSFSAWFWNELVLQRHGVSLPGGDFFEAVWLLAAAGNRIWRKMLFVSTLQTTR